MNAPGPAAHPTNAPMIVKKRRWKKPLLAAAALPCAGIALFFGIFYAAVYCCPYPARDAACPPAARMVLDNHGRALAMFVASDGQWRFPLKYREVSPYLLKAVVAVEDARFYSNHGVDWLSVARAAFDDILARHIVRGASTLTMQVQRLRRPRRRSWSNKFWQAVRAEQIERVSTKRSILLEYVNRAPFGGNIVGAAAASRFYFHCPCADLTLGQAALLAGLPQNPNGYRPQMHPHRARRRRLHVLRRMAALGMITNRQLLEAAAEPIPRFLTPLPQDTSGALADGALPTLVRLAYGQVDARVRTTINKQIQRLACGVLAGHMRRLRRAGVKAGCVVVVQNNNAECRAAVSIGPRGSQIDLTRVTRSTGSTLKPFIYAQAFATDGLGPHSVLHDAPAAWPGYIPADYDRQFLGRITAAHALAQSRNIPALLVLRRVGIQRAVQTIAASGVTAASRWPFAYGLPLAIGGAVASPLELAHAYSILARGGRYDQLHFHKKLVGGNGIVAAAQDWRVLPRRACWQVLRALSDPRRTAAICPEAARLRVAWKTGTSSNHCDAWCAAVTRRFTAVVWLGNLSGKGSPALVGESAAAPVALRILADLHGGRSPWLGRGADGPGATAASPVLAGAAARTGAASFPTQPAKLPAPLTLVLPAPNEHFVENPGAGVKRQRIVFRAVGGRPGGRRWWFVDGSLIKQGGNRVLWKPTNGAHTVRVVDSASHGSAVHFIVRY